MGGSDFLERLFNVFGDLGVKINVRRHVFRDLTFIIGGCRIMGEMKSTSLKGCLSMMMTHPPPANNKCQVPYLIFL